MKMMNLLVRLRFMTRNLNSFNKTFIHFITYLTFDVYIVVGECGLALVGECGLTFV